MGRPRSATVYENGPVRVTERQSGYRVRWMELGSERESSRSTLDEAVRFADVTAERVMLTASGHLSDATAFGALGDAWIKAFTSQWSVGHRRNVESVLDVHVYPMIQFKACNCVNEVDLFLAVNTMADNDYSADWVAQTIQVLRALCKWGVSKGVWHPLANPAQYLKVPEISRLVPRTLIPSISQIDQLQALVAESAPNDDQALRREWLIVAARGTGIRWGELQVLGHHDVNLDTRIISVTKAWHEKEKVGERLGDPKSKHGFREVPIPAEDLELWRRVAAATPDGEYFAQTERGCVWTNSNFNNKVMNPAKAEVEGWPTGAGFHFLRHFALTNMYDSGVLIGDLSKIAGHHSANFTTERYIGPKKDYAESAAKIITVHR